MNYINTYKNTERGTMFNSNICIDSLHGDQVSLAEWIESLNE